MTCKVAYVLKLRIYAISQNKLHQYCLKTSQDTPECPEPIFPVLLLHNFDDCTTTIIIIIAHWSISILSRCTLFLEPHAYPSTITGVPARLRVRNRDWDNGDRKTISTRITTLFHSIRNITDKSVYTVQTRPLRYYLSYSARKQVQSATFFTLNAFIVRYLWPHRLLNHVSVTQADQQTAGNFLFLISSLL